MDNFEERLRFVAKHYREGAMEVDRAWHQFAAKHGLREAWLLLWRWPAVAVVAVLLGGFIYYLIDRQSPDWVNLAASADQPLVAQLPDSTLVSLAPGSTLQYDRKRYNRSDRKVKMKGKVYYEVEHREECPFRVETKESRVTVIGTAFQVEEQATSVDVLVQKGTVSFEAGKAESVILTQGMSAHYSSTDQTIQTQQKINTNDTSWKTGELFFNNTPFDQVVKDLEKFYGVRLRNKRPNPDTLRLTAIFHRRPLDELLRVVNRTLGVQLEVEK